MRFVLSIALMGALAMPASAQTIVDPSAPDEIFQLQLRQRELEWQLQDMQREQQRRAYQLRQEREERDLRQYDLPDWWNEWMARRGTRADRYD